MASEEHEQMVPAPAPIPQDVLKPTPLAHAIEGGPGTGKTKALIAHIESLLAKGADGAQIVVFAATPDAACAFKRRLVNTCPSAAEVQVMTPRAWHLQLLALPEAQVITGRDARLLAPFERDFLMEDLKVSGMRANRIREMMKFFYRSMTELADDEEGKWLISAEEQTAFSMLKNCLGFTRGIIEPELANFAARVLQANPVLKAQMSVAHVVVDDYQMLSRASQVVANLIARESIAIAFDPEASVEVFESYPYKDGSNEFFDVNKNAEHITLNESCACKASVQAMNKLRCDISLAAAALDDSSAGGDEALRVMVAEEPADEMDAICSFIQDQLDQGMRPDEVIIASPHRTWSANIARALGAKGIACEAAADARAVSGDIRTFDRCDAARVLTGLYLVADASDGVAWRSWCGFGDWLTHSNIIYALRDFGGVHGMAIDAALEAVEANLDAFLQEETSSGTQRVIEAYNAGLAMIEQAKDLTGKTLLDFITHTTLGNDAQVPDAVVQLTKEYADGSCAGSDARAMATRARQRLDLPTFDNNDCVHISTYERVAGMVPKVLLLCGFVNGFFPIRDYFDRAAMHLDKAQRQHEHDARLMALVAGKPTQTLAISYFEQTQLEAAEMLKLKLHRIRLKDKKRVALTEPSIFLAQMQA